MTRRIRGLLAALLALAMALGVAPSVALADGDKTVESLGLGTAAITAPTSGGWTKDGGGYVWYGKTPTKYRVLKKDADAMLLDCDSILETKEFDTSSPNTNVWANSTLRNYLNEGTYLNNMFTDSERAAIKDTSITDAGTSNDKVFLLSTTQVNSYYSDDDTRVKKLGDTDDFWWLRSAGSGGKAAFVDDYGIVISDGQRVNDDNVGVSPAFNVNLSSVIFSSLISGVAGQSGAEYKLTLKDAILAASGTATLDGTKATVTYATDGGCQASYLVTDQAWSDSDGWPADAKVLAYGVLGEAGNGEGSFSLPDGCAAEGWGSTYYVYVLAEDVREGNATDCASAPAKVDKPAVSTFAVKVADGIQNGTVTTDKAEAAEGDTVNVTATPADGYELEAITLDGEKVDGTSFKMPASDVTVSATFVKKAEPAPAPAEVPPVSVTAHVQRKGNLPAVSGGAIAGTTGKRLRLESLKLTVPGASATGGIEYRSHVQGKGWERSYARDGALSGTEGKAKRLEAVKIRLWGDMRDKYDVWYRVHSQRYGWMAWAKNGERAGTQGKAFRAEAVQVVLVAKDGPAPDATFQGATQSCAKPFVRK